MVKRSETKGGRTVYRVAGDLLDEGTLETKAVQVIPLNKVCEAVCNIFCDYRDVVATEMVKERPNLSDNLFREALTDVQTTADLAAGLKCDCKCKPI